MSETGFTLSKLIDDSKAVLFSPKEYFQSMPKEGGLALPIIYVLIYGLISGVFMCIWLLLGLTPADLGGGSDSAGYQGIIMIIFMVIASIVVFFIGSLIILILSAICGGNTNFEANARVCASIFVLGPVNALFSFLGAIQMYIAMAVGILIGICGIWMMYNALINALNAKEVPSKIVSIVLTVLVILGVYTARKGGQFGTDMMDKESFGDKYQEEHDKIMKEIPDTEELQKSLEKMKESLRQLQEKSKK